MPADPLHLFAPQPRKPKPRKPSRPRRVLAGLYDAGFNYRLYICGRCDLEWEWRPSDDFEKREADHFERYGTDLSGQRMCPRCNTPETFEAWGETPDELAGEAPC